MRIFNLLLLAFFSFAASAQTYPKTARIEYEDSAGKTYSTTGTVREGFTVNSPVNGGTPIHFFTLTFYGPDGKKRTTAVSEDKLGDYGRLENYYRKNPGESITVSRTTGGQSIGTVRGPVLRMQWNPEFGIREVTGVNVVAAIKDFDRAGVGSKGDPVLDAAGKFNSAGYTKNLRFDGWSGDKPHLLGSDGAYVFPDLKEVDLKQQRFLIDFGKHPFDRDKQLVYPIYVDHFEGEDAVLIAPHEMQKLERAKRGEKVKINYWVVPRNLLRVAPTGEEGDKLLQQSRLQFVEDAGQIVDRGLPMETIIRANHYNAEAPVEVEAGSDMAGSMISVRRQVSEDLKRRGSHCGSALDASS